jgi:hypothetical protein
VCVAHRAFGEEIDVAVLQLIDGAALTIHKESSMKFVTIALAAAVAFSGTVAVAKEKSARKAHHDNAKVRMQPNNGNPNGDPNGPTSLSGTGSSQFGGSSPGTSGRN